MKSIRHTLIVYFLALLTGALGAVSWFSYRTTADSLRERQRDSEKMIATQCATQTQALKAGLDQRILREAQRLAGRARSVTVHTEGLSIVGVAAWLAPGAHPPVSYDLIRTQPKLLVLIDDDPPAGEDTDHAREYFQTYGYNGQPIQRSDSLGDHSLTLDEKVQKELPALTEYFDDVELAPGTKLRRVTLKAPVARSGAGYPLPSSSWRWGGGFGAPKGGPFAKGPAVPKGSPAPKGPPRVGGFPLPTVFIQYASDLGPTEAKILDLTRARDEQLASLETTIDHDLSQLRGRMLAIGLATLVALWLGGYLLIRLGLAPLAKMSEAVSQVSSANFQLPLDRAKLPHELQPIAQRLEEVLKQLQKAFAREKQAAADISHELRTPLAALMTTLEVGLKKPRSPAEYHEILDECRSSGQHMYQLVERLLTLARLDAGADQYRPAETDVIETALNCADLIRPLARARGLNLQLHLPDAITIETDPNKLREVITNLLHNAVEYNRPNGSITLSVERSNGHVRFEVRDTGLGIKPDALEHIFERFYRADPSRHADTPHAGLGLAIVKSYVELMHGSIHVESSEAGTVFIVELPFVESAPHATAIEAAIPV